MADDLDRQVSFDLKERVAGQPSSSAISWRLVSLEAAAAKELDRVAEEFFLT